MLNPVTTLYLIMDKRPLRALSLLMALLLGGCIMFVPAAFAAQTSELAVWQSLVLIWAVCAGVIHGVGFCPRAVLWQGVFSPLPAMLVLLAGLVFFFSHFL